MKEQFDQMNPPKHAKIGGLFFDEVKINEGFVFDHKSWELIGFTDLLDDSLANTTIADKHASDNLATHVLQLFFRSKYFKFYFPCAFFLTGNTTALQLNTILARCN